MSLTLIRIRSLAAYASLRDRDDGQGMTEYALLVGFVVAMVLTATAIFTGVITSFMSGFTL